MSGPVQKLMSCCSLRLLLRRADQKNVINLMDALRRSVQAEGKAPAKKPAKNKKRVAGRGEMLLPITGSKKAAAKETAKPAARRKAG